MRQIALALSAFALGFGLAVAAGSVRYCVEPPVRVRATPEPGEALG